MKFGKELKASIVQAWRNKYVRYALIKSKLKELRKLYDEHNIAINSSNPPLNAETLDLPSLLNTNSSLKLFSTNSSVDNEDAPSPSSKTRAEFERYMNGLQNLSAVGKRRNSKEESLESMIEFIPSNKNEAASDSNEFAESSPSKKYRFSKVAEIVDANLESKMPHFEPKLQEIGFKEKEIVVLLEQDIFTVSKFYAQQCQYFAEQHNALIILVEDMCKNQIEVNTQNTQWKTEEEDPFGGAVKGILKPHLFGSDTLEHDDSGLEDMSFDKAPRERLTSKDIADEKSNLRVLFRQMYNAVRMLEKYRKINQMAFYKITKKHDKNSGRFKNLQQITARLIHSRCNFGNDYFTLFLQKRLEYLYSQYLKPSDQKSSEALERLRHPPSTKEIQTESFIIGLCGGWSIAMLLIAIILVATLYDSFWSNWSVYRSWYMFRASMAMSIYLWLWGCDLWVFQKYQFNHGFIFGADPTTLMRVPHVWNIAAILSVTTMLFTIFFVLAFMFDGIFTVDPEIFSIMCLFCWLLYGFIPFPWVKHTKKFLLKSLGKQIISPFSTVEFIDFFMADQWTSLFTLVVDLLFSFCYLFTGDFLLSGDTQSLQCDNVKTKAWLSLFKLVPYWIRFWQCIRRARDSHHVQKSTKWHFANAGKYSFAIIVTFINAFHVYYNSTVTKVFAVVFGAIATIYAYCWDIYKDWGLLRFSKNKQHKILREELTYPASSYYAAMVINFVCRIAWAVSLFPASFGVYDAQMMHYLKLPLNIAEIVRRCMWNLFRIENEHLNNCGEFRVVKDIPIAQHYVSSIKINFEKSNERKDRHHQDNDNRIELQQIEEEEEVKLVRDTEEEEEEKEDTSSVITSSKDDEDEDVLVQSGDMMEIVPLTKHRTNTISDRTSVNMEPLRKDIQAMENKRNRNVRITRSSFAKPKHVRNATAVLNGNDNHDSSESDSVSSPLRSRRKLIGNNEYMAVSTQYFDDDDRSDTKPSSKRKRNSKKWKPNSKKRKRNSMKRAEGQETNHSEHRPLPIKRIKSDETSSDETSSQHIAFGDITYKKRGNTNVAHNNNEHKFIRIRGDCSPVYSEDSEISESRTWPKRYNKNGIHTKYGQKKEISEDNIIRSGDRKMHQSKSKHSKGYKRTATDHTTTATTTTDNTTEIVFKKRNENGLSSTVTTVSTTDNYNDRVLHKLRDSSDEESDAKECSKEDINDRYTKITRLPKRNHKFSKSTENAIGLVSSVSSSKRNFSKSSKRNRILMEHDDDEEDDDSEWTQEINGHK